MLLNEDERVIHLLRWGLVPHWAKSASTDYSMINARAESIEQKPAFREALNKRRCLVLADSFYEWQKTPTRPDTDADYAQVRGTVCLRRAVGNVARS